MDGKMVSIAGTGSRAALAAHRQTRLRSLTVVLTSACNLRCAYCYQNAKRTGRMAWPTLEAALARLVHSGRPRVSVTFTGGEPLLEFPLIQRAVSYVRAHTRRDQAIDVDLSTNGTLLGPREARFLARAGVNVQISLDGVPSVQAVRGSRTFQVLDGTLDRLRRDYPSWFAERISVSTAVMADTLDALPDSVAYILSKGVREIALGPALTDQPGWRPDRIGSLRHRMAQVFRLSALHCRQTGDVPVRLFRNHPGRRLPPEPSRTLCGAGHPDYLTVDIDGEVSGCVLFARSYQRFPDTVLGRALATLHAGRIDDPGLDVGLADCRQRIEATGLFTNRGSKFSSYDRCGTCRHRRRCSLCPVTIVHQPGNADPNRVPDFACAFQRAAGAFRGRLSPAG